MSCVAEGTTRPRSARILVVEDEYMVATDLADRLTEGGFDVTGIAATAEDALILAAAERPDLVIMDIRLASRRDGIEAAIELKQRHGLRCIFATAHLDAETRSRAAPAAPLGWLAKPYGTFSLFRQVQAALNELKQT
jgi:two-component system, response regulator PdtaR